MSRGNPNMRVGAPSVNPAGRSVSKSALEAASRIAKKGAPGTDGFWAPGGFIVTGERDPKLQNRQKWVTYDNLIANVAIVAAAVNIWLTLAGSVKWRLTPNKNGGRNATKCMDLVQDGLIDARMSKPWRSVVRRQMMKRFRGFAMHAKSWRVDSKGRSVLASLEHRPQWTVERWIQAAEGEPWTAVVQRGRSGRAFDPIDREDLFYSVEDGITGEADGYGVFRSLVKLANTLDGLEQLERIGFDTDMRGMPYGRAPLSKLAAEAVTYGGCAPDDKPAIAAYIQGQTKFLDDLLKNHMVTKDRSILLDSTTCASQSSDGSLSPSAIYEWSIDTVKTATTSMPELATAISRVTGYAAMLCNVEWMLLGSADTSGTYGMHSNKTAMMGLALNGGLDDIADDGNRDIVWPMCARNGYNPETDAPTLEHEPIPTESVDAAARALVYIQQAGLRPDDPAADVLRARMELPPAPQPDPETLMAPRGVPPKDVLPPAKTPSDGSRDQTTEMHDNPDAIPEGEAA